MKQLIQRDVEIPEWLPQESRVVNVYLREGPMTASEAGERLGMSMSATWNHLKRLCDDGVMQVVGKKRPVGHGRIADVYAVVGDERR